ncbi:MAG: hypothetical protein WBC22_13765 [Sedimentisphaerales bacterium]
MSNKTLFWSFFASFCASCASLRLTITVFRRLMKKAISMALWAKVILCVKSSLLEQNLPGTPSQLRIISVNPVILSNFSSCSSCTSWLKNPFNLRNPRLINDLRSTKVYVRKNNLFMQNKANFRKVKLNVIQVLTNDYDQMDTWSIRKIKPIQSQLKPIQSQSNPIKANKMPKQTQTNPISEEKKPAKRLADENMTRRTDKQVKR